jgi:enoyl-CoA hydratase
VSPSSSILVEVRDSFTPEMERLRREYTDATWVNETTQDDFDSLSKHITISANAELVGMVRLTKRPYSVLAAWGVGREQLPGGSDTAEITRAVVARRWRGMGLYKLLMAEATRYCEQSGVALVVGVIELDFPLRDFLRSIGFSYVGSPIEVENPPLGLITGQIIAQQPARALNAVSASLAASFDKLKSRGFTVHSSVGDRVQPHVHAVRDGGVLAITLDRPAKLNALTSGMVSILARHFQEAARDDSVRVVSIAGVGRAFCAGADLQELNADDRALAADFVRLGAEMVTSINGLGKPMVASIGGQALGGGLELALGCTLRIASDRATFGLPEARLGIMPGWGGTQRLARLCGQSRTALLALTGEPIDASTAQSWGMVDRLVPHESLAEATALLCRQLAAMRPEAVSGIMNAVGAVDAEPTAVGLRFEAALFRELFLHPDTQEVIAAFMRARLRGAPCEEARESQASCACSSPGS